jgi:hypothetical protein
MPRRIPVQELIGKRYHKLILLNEVEPEIYPNGEKKRRFRCQCDCGNITEARMSDMRSGRTNSCGCFRDEKIATVTYSHGLHDTVLYSRWKGMKKRCYNKNHKQFRDWGGRGIKVCEEWKEDFRVFYDWAINYGFRKDLHLDRIDNNGNYEPGNCRFVTQAENNRNQRIRKDSRLLTYSKVG